MTSVAERCPDTGACHHDCDGTPAEGLPCFRVLTCGPLGIAKYPRDEWPDDVLVRHQQAEIVRLLGPVEDDEHVDAVCAAWNDASAAEIGAPPVPYDMLSDDLRASARRVVRAMLEGGTIRLATPRQHVGG